MRVGNDRYPYSLLNDSLSTISEALWALPQKLAVPRPQKLELDCRAHYWSRESQGCRLREPVYRWTVNGLRLPGRDCERPPVPFEPDPISMNYNIPIITLRGALSVLNNTFSTCFYDSWRWGRGNTIPGRWRHGGSTAENLRSCVLRIFAGSRNLRVDVQIGVNSTRRCNKTACDYVRKPFVLSNLWKRGKCKDACHVQTRVKHPKYLSRIGI